jgi:hypothetical protein
MIIIIITRFPRTPEDLSPEDQAIFLHENDAAFEMTDAARDALNEDDPNQTPHLCSYCRSVTFRSGEFCSTACADEAAPF